jgi:peroxiredoxin
MKLISIPVFLLISVLAFAQSSSGQHGMDPGSTPEGLEVGDKAPDFTGTTASGELAPLDKFLDNGPVVLVFYRGYWCPHCTRYLSRYADSLAYLEQLGAQIIAVTPEEYRNVDRTVDATAAEFTVLSDPTEKIMGLYKVMFDVTDAYAARIARGKGSTLQEMHGTDKARLPVPATYIIRRDDQGVARIIWRHFDYDYRTRASVADMIEAIRASI